MKIGSGLRASMIGPGFGILLAAAGCATGGGDSAGAPGTNAAPLRVGVTPNMPPLVYKQGHDLVGLEVDLARELGRELGRPVRFVEVKWDDQIPALRDRRTDIIMSGMSVTRLRALRVAFTDPYLEVGQMALVRRSDLERFITRGAVMMTDGKVGVEKATTGDLFVQQEFTRAERKVYSSPSAAVRDLLSGRLDLFIHDAPVVWWLAAENEDRGLAVVNSPLTSEVLAWGLRDDEAGFRQEINRILARWKRQETLQGLVRRWIPYARAN